MFGKEAKYWKSTKSILADLIGADEDLTDAELVQAAIDFKAEHDDEGDDTEGDKKETKPVKTPAKSEAKEEKLPLEVEETDIQLTTDAKLDKVLAAMDGLTKRVGSIEKLPFRGQGTTGERSKAPADSKEKYSETQAPKFVD